MPTSLLAYTVVHPFVKNSGTPLTIYRVTKEFTLGNVTWPVGAIRYWSDSDRNEFMANLPIECDIPGNFLVNHFEQIEFRYPEAVINGS